MKFECNSLKFGVVIDVRKNTKVDNNVQLFELTENGNYCNASTKIMCFYIYIVVAADNMQLHVIIIAFSGLWERERDAARRAIAQSHLGQPPHVYPLGSIHLL